jgi:hypothetical protein
MSGETDFGTEFTQARIGNPLLYARRIYLCVISSFFAQTKLEDYPGAPNNPYQLICDSEGGIAPTSKIFISDRYSTEDTARRPQIVVGRGTAVWRNMVLGDKGQGVSGAAAWTREREYTDSLYIPIEISVYSKSDIEAENLAWSISYCLKAFEREIRIGSLLFNLESSSISSAIPDKVSDNIEQFKIMVQTGATIALRWKKITTLDNEDIQRGFCKISGDPYPVSIKDLCIFATPVTAPESWT